MAGYLDAWLVIGGAGLIGAVVLFFLTRGLANPWLRAVLRWLPPVLLIVPAPVPGYEGHLAPAFVVLIFEGLFQNQGHPGTALAILLGAALLVLVVLLGLTLAMGRRAPLRAGNESGHSESGQTPS